MQNYVGPETLGFESGSWLKKFGNHCARQYKHRVIYMIFEVTHMQEHDMCVFKERQIEYPISHK